MLKSAASSVNHSTTKVTEVFVVLTEITKYYYFRDTVLHFFVKSEETNALVRKKRTANEKQNHLKLDE